jgi:PKD repeat protein
VAQDKLISNSRFPLRLFEAVRHHRARISRGQALVEFALVLPLAMFLLLFVIDFGRLFASYVDVSNASREGAAYAAGNPTDTAGIVARARAETNTQGQVGQGALTITSGCLSVGGTAIDCGAAAGGGGSGNTVTVTATERFTFITPVISIFFSGGVNLHASTTASVLSLAASGGNAPGNCTTPPVAAFTYTVSGKTVTLDASTSSPTTDLCAISGYNWDMGDGANPFPPIVGRNVTYTYGLSGTYHVTLMVSNSAGSVTIQQTITVDLAPVPTGTPAPTPIHTPTPRPTVAPPVCNTAPGFTYSFTGNGNGSKAHQVTFYGGYTGQPVPATWMWTFGNGESDDGQTRSIDYEHAGTYTVTLTVKNGSCTATVSHVVVVP